MVPSSCTPEGDLMTDDTESMDGVDSCEADVNELDWLLVELIDLPEEGKRVLHKDPNHDDHFAGYVVWKVEAEGQSYYLPAQPVRKVRNAYRPPQDVNGYAVYSTNKARMRISELKRKKEDA